MNTFVQQYERTKRWYGRMQEITNGKDHSAERGRPTNYYYDDLLAFFINCYHLKDWLINDEEANIERANVEEFINSSKSLSICADICNGTKHSKLTSSRADLNTKFGGRHFALGLGGAIPLLKIKYTIISGNATYDAFELATNCIDDWNQFLKKNKLL